MKTVMLNQRMLKQLVTAASLLILLPSGALGLQVGDQICIQGFIMDFFCIENVNMIDNGRITLEEPELHTVHCLADIGVCLETPYEVLVESPMGDTPYRRGYRLDEDSKQNMLELVRSVGSCSTCANGYDNSMLNEGFRAVMLATVLDLNEESEDDVPPLVRVDQRKYANPLGNDPCRSEFNAMEGVPISPQTTTNEFQSVSLTEGSLLGTLESKINLSDPNANGQDTITIRYTVPQLSWVGIGVNPTGTGMVNGEVVIGRPMDNNSVLKYRITARSRAAISEQPNQTLINPSLEQVDGNTILTFTKLLVEDGEYTISAGVNNTFIAAYGFSNAFGFHQGYGVQSVMLASGSSAATDAPVATPTDAPVPTSPPTMDDPNAIDWRVQSYNDRVVKVGETITFHYDEGHNVYIHPTGTCDETGSILVGDNGDGPASYTFTAMDAGRAITFACNVGFHCEAGQMITFQVDRLVRKQPTGPSKEGLKAPRKSNASTIFGDRVEGSIRGGGRRLSNAVPQESW